MARAQRFGNLLDEAGLDPVQTAAQFAARRGEITAAHERASQAADDCQKRLKEVAGDERTLREESEKVNAELRSLRERKSNIPKRNLDIRRLLCQELKLTESALPFAGELITVLEHESDWEGAAERLLHGFALSILVPDEHYAPVADWINDHFLNGRVVYYRVPAMAPASRDARRPRQRPLGDPQPLVGQAGRQGHAVRLLGGGRAGDPRRLRVRRDHGRIPPHAAGHHAGRADQGRGRAAREGRPVPHR